MKKMKAIFVANFELEENEGIFKKVCAQSDAIGKNFGSCDLITRKGKNAIVKAYSANKQVEQNIGFYDYILKQILCGHIELIYVRHMIPNLKLIKILRLAKKRGIILYYEIPTYPYFGEQFKTSRRKYRAIVKIGLDIIFWPVIYHYIDKLVVIRSNSKSHHFRKMIEITNGVKTSDIKSKDYSIKRNENVFSMVAVGTLYPYHGYDKMLKGLAACKEKIDGKIIEFHVIGSSTTIDELHSMSDSLGLKHVFFHGIKTTKELNEMYDNFDVGLGCLALHRRNADIDTTLKVIEYYCRGVPVVSSGKCPFSDERFSCIIPDNEDAVDIKKIYNYYCGFTTEELMSISKIAKEQFSWNNIMYECIKINIK